MSQFGQDDWCLEHHNFKKNGTYLEIGVHDGHIGSNTEKLDIDYGWTGVCIDPFMKNMQNRTCEQVHVALGSENNDQVSFLWGDSASPLSGVEKFVTSETDNKKWAETAKAFEKTTVKMRTPKDVLQGTKLPSVIDYMSLDVEGSEMDILSSFPFDEYCIRYATIETNDDKSKERELEAFMADKGYKFEKHEGVDHVFSKDCQNPFAPIR